ncbi:hypothetical protein [Gymnodinialimonas hymeniacidonis]|uniref:hypothetical protein n=1 Tax=Gymnodinialimonas hymeniacidonis TaxID=3126508 RepID=UPI0034C6437B
MLALIFHRAILLDEQLSIWMTPTSTDADQKKWPFLPFSWRFALLFLPLILVFGGLVALFLPAVGAEQAIGALLLALIVTTLLSPFWLAAAGTMLPAAAIGGDARFKAAFRRAKNGYWRTVLRLFLGPILYQIAVIGLLIAVLEPTLEGVWEQLPVAIELLIYSVIRTLGFVTPLLTATALSMAYQRSEAVSAQPAP